MEDDELQTLLSAIRAGNSEAFNEFYRKFGQRLVPYFLASGLARNTEDAEDRAQETLIRVWRSLERGESEFVSAARFISYVKKIARNVALDYIRKMKGESGNVYLDDEEGLIAVEIPDSRPGPDKLIEEAQETQKAAPLLDGLTTAQRQAFILKEREGYSYQEIAELEGCSVDAVRGRLAEARKKIFENIARMGDISSA